MKYLIHSLLLISLVSCAPIPQSYEPIIDYGTNDFNYIQYGQDLRECQAYSDRISPADQAIGEALAGAAFGAALGAILGTGFDNVGNRVVDPKGWTA